MHDIMRKRILRALESLPEEQLFQVVDYMEFLQSKYARTAGLEPSAFQRFAERIEDNMRLRAVAPRAMRGTMRVMSTASRILDEISDVGRGILDGPERPTGPGVSATGSDDGSESAAAAGEASPEGPAEAADAGEAGPDPGEGRAEPEEEPPSRPEPPVSA